ncbi:uncharacterized protein JCM15063_005909 [Sporobolomyces koalae]|uniref:uncharacterized protein n=1 Tax=Sporobolomyces koalae TaxID=500713 RepID=UPI003179475C
MPDLGDVVKQTLAQKKAAEAKGETFAPFASPSSTTPADHGPDSNSSQRQNSQERSQSRSSKHRPPSLDPPFATAPLSPLSDSTSLSTEPASPLGLDHPRPKHRTQASFDWFGDFKAQGGFGDAPSQASPSGRSHQGGTESPRGTNFPRSDSPASLQPSEHQSVQSPSTSVPTNSRRRNDANGKNRSGSYPTSSSHESDDDRERAFVEGNFGSEKMNHTLRGAFTAEDFDRGQKKIQYGEGPVGQPSSKSTHARAKMVKNLLHPTQSSHGSDKDKHAKKGDTMLSRSSSAGAAETGSVPMNGDASNRGRARSVRSQVDAQDEADEERDQFDTDAPAGSRSRTASRRPTAFSNGSKKSSGWGKLRTATAGSGATGDASGTSTPREHSDDEAGDAAGPGPKRPANAGARRGSAWNVVRKKLGGGDEKKKQKARQGAALSGHELISELTTGVLPLVLIKMAVMDRDERGDHRIPILMNYLKLRITDSVYPFHDRHAIFRIELEYGDGAVKWVIYRELKDFVNLHAHYRVANLRLGVDKFPAFPKTSLPYLGWLRGEGKGEHGEKGDGEKSQERKAKEVGKAEFARGQREALESYLLKLIRATMFGPSANRLCKFLEISAMSIQLATRGGEQGKQGYLRITSGGASRRKQPGFHPLSWKKRHDPKWFIVRDSYLVAVDDPASTEIYEVMLVDSTFEIERPTRMYRKGLKVLAHDNSSAESLAGNDVARTDGLLSDEPKPQGHHGAGDPNDPSATNSGKGEDSDLKDTSNHTFYLRSSERKLRLVAKTERQQDQFIASIEKMLAKTIWAGRNRFDSFAPIRLNVAAQWLIDGRDYFWSLSRAIALAKHKIYIHDWWLSPELYLRRPPHKNEKWRLDRLLQRKAREGVQVFVIVYKEVSNDFTPVDSNWTKTRLRGLHPNIHVQRSPSHTSTGTLLWSHHEKMCVIDETIGFMGGLDLCFGRWDTPGHVMVDDGPNIVFSQDPQNLDRDQADNAQIWPGKDYCNQRVIDFHTLNKPEEDMYDRGKVPRQPWHDIGLQIIGQPARDLCRHFIQRWNYLLRTKNHTVKMPFLIPAPDFTPKQLQDLRITGTCEVQICRSVGPWSMGITHVEHSIQNAYIKAIQLSDHFVYIENQFFISSTEVEGTVIENKIGDALVSRIVRAHTEGTPWRAMIVVPLVPGYPFPIDHSEASSVRLIMECQFRTICRGEHSIFARLRAEGIDPDEYITFFGLRGWGKLSSGALTTESTYIHAKGMIVDDRIALIGSANINERSQRGDRDSELACIIRDTDMIESTMGGKPYQVGRFAHTMRVRLMREHLGIDVDELESSEGREELLAREAKVMKEEDDQWDPDNEQKRGDETGTQAFTKRTIAQNAKSATAEYTGGVATGIKEAISLGFQKTTDNMKINTELHHDRVDDDPIKQSAREETKADRIARGEEASKGFASTVVPTLEEKMMAEDRPKPDARAEDGEEPQGRQQADREREDGVQVQAGWQKRQIEEGRDDAADDENDELSPRSNGIDGADPKQTVQRLQGNKNDKSPYTDADPERFKGEPVDQSSKIDDTRKLGRAESDESEGALSPIAEGAGDDNSDPEAGPTPKDPKVNGEYTHPADPSPASAPPDITNADQGYHSMLDGQTRDKSKAETSHQGSDAKADSNQSAISRNKVTATIRRNLKERGAYTVPLAKPKVDPHGFADPLVDTFYKDVWLAAAVRNTQIFRKVFRTMPDDLVQTWKQYREFQAWAERHNKPPKDVVPPGDEAPHTEAGGHSCQHGAGGGGSSGGVMGQGADEPDQTETIEKQNSRLAASTTENGSIDDDKERGSAFTKRGRSSTLAGDAENKQGGRGRSSTLAGGEGHDHDEAFPKEERDQMEDLLHDLTGQLVVFPTRFLEAESAGSNFLFSKDRIPPMAIYD